MSSLHNIATLGILDKVGLNFNQDLGRQCTGLFGKDLRFNEFKPDNITCSLHAL
jgi:hypothetical protein